MIARWRMRVKMNEEKMFFAECEENSALHRNKIASADDGVNGNSSL
jgi:hypothetical protein